MQEIYKIYKDEYGYTPFFAELWGYYTDGSLSLNDKQEDIIIKEAENRGIL